MFNLNRFSSEKERHEEIGRLMDVLGARINPRYNKACRNSPRKSADDGGKFDEYWRRKTSSVAGMTWIVAMPRRGVRIGCLTFRVTLSDGSERDCLQKIYPIANSLALGFAGSVYIGLKHGSTMQTSLSSMMRSTLAADGSAERRISMQAREIFAGASVAEKS